MNFEYITTYEVYQSGERVANGNQSLTLTSNGTAPPNATELLEAIKNDAAKKSNCAAANIHITGVFRL